MVTSLHALDAALFLDNPATRWAHFLYERDPMPTCFHVAQYSSAQVLLRWSTPKEPQVCLAAHNLFQHKGPWATDEIVRSRQLVFHSTCDVRAHFVGAQRTMTPPSSTPCSVCFSPVCRQGLHCHASPAKPHPTLSRPLMPRLAPPLELSRAALPRPPGARSPCPGRYPFVGLFVVLFGAACVDRSLCSYLRPLLVAHIAQLLSVALWFSYHTTSHSAHSTHLTQTTHTTCTSTPLAPYTPCTSHTPHSPHTLTTPCITPPTPRALHTHHIHTTPHLLTTHSHPPHQSHYHSFLSTQVWDGVQFTVCLGCTLCLNKSTQFI
jgi:hypothetical protein